MNKKETITTLTVQDFLQGEDQGPFPHLENIFLRSSAFVLNKLCKSPAKTPLDEPYDKESTNETFHAKQNPLALLVPRGLQQHETYFLQQKEDMIRKSQKIFPLQPMVRHQSSKPQALWWIMAHLAFSMCSLNPMLPFRKIGPTHPWMH